MQLLYHNIEIQLTKIGWRADYRSAKGLFPNDASESEVTKFYLQ